MTHLIHLKTMWICLRREVKTFSQLMCQFVQRTLTLSTILMATTLLCNDGHDAWASKTEQKRKQIQMYYLKQGIANEFGIKPSDEQLTYMVDNRQTIENIVKQFLRQERAAGRAVAQEDINYVIRAHEAGRRGQALLDEAARLKQQAQQAAAGQQGGAPAQSGAAQSLQAGVGPYPLAMPLQHGLAAGLQGVDGSVDAVIRGLFGRGKVQRAVDVDGGTAITAQHRAAVEALKKVVVIDDNHIPAGQFVRAMRLVTVGFESFDLSHLLAVWKLQTGYGERGDHDYRAPLAYSAITADDVRAMVVLTTNRGGRFDVRDLGEELCGVRLEEPSDLMIEAVKGLGRLRDEGFRETFGTAEVMAYYALKQQRSGHVYGAPPLRREPTVEQIRAVVDLRRVLNGYAVGEPEREAYRREVVWRIRRDGGRIPGALAVVVKERYDWARHEPDGGHDRLLWVLWTQPGTHLQDDQGYFFPAQQTFAIRQEDVGGSLPYRRGVHALVTFQGLRRVANAPIGGVPALTLIDPDQHP